VPKAARTNRITAWLTALFFALLLAVGLLTSVDYGQPWDEPWEMDILRMNGNQYAAALGIATRAETQSTLEAPESGLIADSEEKDHGVCAYYPMLWLVNQTSLSESTRMILWHAYTWLWFTAGAAALWFICRRLGLSRGWSCTATLFLALSPRMFAQGHYNNKDMVLLSLVLLTVWLAMRLMERPGVARAALFSLAGAAATNTKVVGLFVWGLCALFVLLRLLADKRMDRRAWGAALTALAAYLGFYALLTPALWAGPSAFLQYLFTNAVSFSRWQNRVFFRGAVFDLKLTSLPWYYLPYTMLVTTPLWVLLPAAAGQIFAVGRFLGPRRRPLRSDGDTALLLCTLLWLLPMLFVIIRRPTLYNGWRHFYFLYGPILVLAAYGLKRIWAALGKPRTRVLRRAGAALLALCMAVTGAQMVLAHPNEYTYYNILLSGKNIPAYMELDYWNVSVLQTLRSLLAQLDAGETVTVSGADNYSETGLRSGWKLLSAGEQARLTVLPSYASAAEYVLSNNTYTELSGWQPDGTMRIVAQTESYGLPLCTVYARETTEPADETP